MTAICKEYDAASEKKKGAAKDKILETIQKEAFSEANLLKLEKECIARDLTDLENEIQRKLLKLFLARDVYTRAKEVFAGAESVFKSDVEILKLMSESAEQKGDVRFAQRCLDRLFKEYDNMGNTEFAVATSSRILSIEPHNSKAINYIAQFADSKKRFTASKIDKQLPVQDRKATGAFQKKEQSRKLFELCQNKLRSKTSADKAYQQLQKKFITALTEESLGNYDESIRMFSEIEQAI